MAQNNSADPICQSAVQLNKKEDMRSIFRNQVDSLKTIRHTITELQSLNKLSAQKQKVTRENYEQQLSNFKKIRKDFDIIHKLVVKVLVCEERISLIKEEQNQLKKEELKKQEVESVEFGDVVSYNSDSASSTATLSLQQEIQNTIENQNQFNDNADFSTSDNSCKSQQQNDEIAKDQKNEGDEKKMKNKEEQI